MPGHGPVCRGEEVERILDGLNAYAAFVKEVAAESYVQRLTRWRPRKKHRDNPHRGRAVSERLVGNLHRTYAELADEPPDSRITVSSLWPEMVAFHGSPIECHA